MKEYKGITFAAGWEGTLAQFKKHFAPLLKVKNLSEDEIKEAHAIVTAKDGDVSDSSKKSEASDSQKD